MISHVLYNPGNPRVMVMSDNARAQCVALLEILEGLKVEIPEGTQIDFNDLMEEFVTMVDEVTVEDQVITSLWDSDVPPDFNFVHHMQPNDAARYLAALKLFFTELSTTVVGIRFPAQ